MANSNNIEVEFKLALGPQGSQAAANSSVLRDSKATRMPLGNRYFDTPAGALRRHGLALRLRKGEGEHIIQTLKSQGTSTGGLSERGEWQWQRDADALDLAALKTLAEQTEALAVLADDEVLNALTPLFETDFERHAYTLDWHGARVELAIDQGVIKAGEKECRINEMELELKGGDPESMWSLADTLASEVILRPANASKAARAAALITPRDMPGSLPSKAEELLATVIQGLDIQQDESDNNRGTILAQQAAMALASCCPYPEAEQLADCLKDGHWQHSQRFGELALALSHSLGH